MLLISYHLGVPLHDNSANPPLWLTGLSLHCVEPFEQRH